MTLTNYINGLSSFGIPVIPMGLFGVNSKVFFVDYVNGSDGNRGTTLNKPLKTLSKAHSLCTAGRGDVVLLLGNGATSGTNRQDETLTWSKNNTHLFGISPGGMNPRARIATTSGTDFTPLTTISADGCQFSNMSLYHGYDSAVAQICMNMTGQRNVFNNCRISGMGHATAGDQAGSSSLSLTGDGENEFNNCIIGLDTVARSTTNAEIDFKSAAVRNRFNNCLIETFADNAGHLFVKADSSGDLDRYTNFNNCTFSNAVASTATTMTAAISVHASVGGFIFVKNCSLIGTTHWTAADTTNVYIDGAVPNGQTTGIAVSSDTP